eukprot:scaffold3079_cov119-Cylindrotheca_fusiformis.AAC.3
MERARNKTDFVQTRHASPLTIFPVAKDSTSTTKCCSYGTQELGGLELLKLYFFSFCAKSQMCDVRGGESDHLSAFARLWCPSF